MLPIGLTGCARALISKTFELAPGAEIVRPDKRMGHLDDLRVGDHVKVSYYEENGVKRASRIEQTAEQ